MASYLVCLTTAGGVPLFTRTADDLKPLPFPVIGSLNGVHMFGSSHDVTLQSTVTEDAKIVWRVFHDSVEEGLQRLHIGTNVAGEAGPPYLSYYASYFMLLEEAFCTLCMAKYFYQYFLLAIDHFRPIYYSVTLIAIAQNDDADDCHYSNLLNLVFNSMVLLVGIEEVTNMKNVEKFKKEIKVCYNLVDRILGFKGSWGFCQLTNAVEIIAAPENAVLQNFLDAFTEAAESVYGCLFIDGKVAVATKKWWSLSANELVLLSLLLSSLTPCTSRDIPVYLPDSHPTVPHRLMTFQLTRGIEVCVICGPSPSLTELEPEILRFWKPSYDSLRSVLKLSSRNFPTNLALDHNTLGFLLINKETNRCLCSISPTFNGGHPDETLSPSQRKEVLMSFYKRMVGTFFSSVVPGSESGPSEFSHQAMESYITTETHKCYAMMSGPHQLFMVYGEGIPTYAMRSITQKTLSLLTKDRNISV